jgi:hypothetical protein
VSADLERDLGAWSRGELTRERLIAAHGPAATGTVALHERLVSAVAATAIPDAEAGWAALLTKIEAPAPVVPLRRHARRRRTISLLVAASIVVAGSAFAAIWTGNHRGVETPAPPTGALTSLPGGAVGAGSGSEDRRTVPPPSPIAPSAGPGGGGPSSADGSGSGEAGPGAGGDGSTSTDDPRDRDHGTGNDGSHDDRGSGNNGRSGSLPHGSNGKSH